MTAYRYKLPDIVITTNDDKEIYFHKEPLCAHSSYFKAMFTHEMEEKRQNKIELDDSYQDLIMFLDVYQNHVVINHENINTVFKIAHKYNFDEILQKCMKVMKDHAKQCPMIEIIVKDMIHISKCYERI